MKSARIREIIQPRDNIANKVIAVECRIRFYLAAIHVEALPLLQNCWRGACAEMSKDTSVTRSSSSKERFPPRTLCNSRRPLTR
jgi:hypothetical protein